MLSKAGKFSENTVTAWSVVLLLELYLLRKWALSSRLQQLKKNLKFSKIFQFHFKLLVK